MKNFFFFPPLPRFSGGMAVIAQVAAYLHEAGEDAALVLREAPTPARSAEIAALAPGVPTLLWDELRLTPEDRWIVPEGWPMALGPGLSAKARCLLYVQNWAYLHGLLPEGTRWQDLPVGLFAVSDPVAWFVRETTGRDVPVLRPAIRPDLFHPEPGRNEAAPLCAGEAPRIAWMPRKNKALARQIRDIFEARLGLAETGGPAPLWVEIHGRSREEVAGLLRSSHIFLATGFPEGCPLPPLEALASGCLLAGFGGFGGWDYMRQALPGGFTPWWPLREVPWEANGFFAADADVIGAALALEQAVYLVRTGGDALAALRRAGARTAAWYSPERQRQGTLALFA